MPRKKPPEIPYKRIDFPTKLMAMLVSPKKLETSAYQKKLHAWAAAHLLPEAYQVVYQHLQDGNLEAAKRVFEDYGISQPKSKISIVQNNAVDARSLQLNEGEGGDGARGHANFIRMLAEQREKKRLEGGIVNGHPTLDATFSETPEGPRKD